MTSFVSDYRMDEIWFAFHSDEFKYYCCPVCSYRSRSEDQFKKHAVDIHKVSKDLPWLSMDWVSTDVQCDFQSGQDFLLRNSSSDVQSQRETTSHISESDLETTVDTDSNVANCQFQSGQDSPLRSTSDVQSQRDNESNAEYDVETTLESVGDTNAGISQSGQNIIDRRQFECDSNESLETLGNSVSVEPSLSIIEASANTDDTLSTLIMSSVNTRDMPLDLDKTIVESEVF